MPTIVDLKAYDGFTRRVERLGLSLIVEEIKTLLTGFKLLISEERKHANGAAVIREVLDARFAAVDGWQIIKSGGIIGPSASATMAPKPVSESSCKSRRGATC